MTEEEKQAIRASFAGKRVSQMTALERQVFDGDFQYGFGTNKLAQSRISKAPRLQKESTQTLSLLKWLGLR